MAAPGGWGSASNTVYAASEASCPSYIAATAGKIRRHGPRFDFTARGVRGYDLTVLIMGRDLPELPSRPPVKRPLPFGADPHPPGAAIAARPEQLSRYSRKPKMIRGSLTLNKY
jgi:hypothetical protein